MSPSELAALALEKVRTLPKPAPAPDQLASPNFLEQEPDLVKETGQHNRQASAWAAGGTSE